MSDKLTVTKRLQSRLSKVPGVTAADIDMWVAESVTESGFSEVDNANAVFYLALYNAYSTIASDAARYFSYGDRDEVVDKTKVFKNYMELAKEARLNYRKAKKEGEGTSFSAYQTHAGRADRR
ncbi:hypothetical protein [Virgibacillus pantothenticus]|uniref:hypothetical protein n=1 Tax=Virgibacillus pantothenticus TaxID=1473 RepID=UPI002014ED91|nr:hypothetical protein [Virgibacillus pantothenticus]